MYLIYDGCNIRTAVQHNSTKYNGKEVTPESERYRKCLFGYSRIVHRDTALSLWCLAIGINLVRDKGPRD